jgi:hypothetical protein
MKASDGKRIEGREDVLFILNVIYGWNDTGGPAAIFRRTKLV